MPLELVAKEKTGLSDHVQLLNMFSFFLSLRIASNKPSLEFDLKLLDYDGVATLYD